jgi:hypothetical protein
VESAEYDAMNYIFTAIVLACIAATWAIWHFV